MDITIHIPEMDKLSAAVERLAAALGVAGVTKDANPTAAAPVQSASQPFMASAPASAALAAAPIAPASTTQPFFTAPQNNPGAAGFSPLGLPAQQRPVNPLPAAAMPNAPISAPSQGFPMTQIDQIAQAAPAVSSNPAPQQAPIAAPQYTIDDLARAASALTDMGKDIPSLLAQFGAKMLTELPKEQYGAFATMLRQMGARI